MSFSRKSLTAAVLVGALALTACSSDDPEIDETESVTLDYSTYNPLSLVVKEAGWLEEELDGEVEWVYSAGSNRANEHLRIEAIDVGSTAGSAALLARASGTEIQTISVLGDVEWTALVVPQNSDVESVADLEGRTVAATHGTDPYFFLAQALEEAGLTVEDITIDNLQHGDGYTALDNDSVDAWAGLDPVMAEYEEDTEFLYRNADFNTYSVLNATESFLEESPDVAQTVVETYERARQWALEHPEETAQLLADQAEIDLESAKTIIEQRSGFDISPVPGEEQAKVLSNLAPTYVSSGVVDDQQSVDEALDTLFAPEFAEEAESAE
ncbi:aliphatic sulfonate ABC transporter substrate-binding protein [Yaniella halotolerans]|uniref:aliphatic sulfonate ABC transporter substrate-binding protein n=1 Tax=Yaniella halotolerans TaxID=225453 RepID=UPI0003B500A8|nr:aliphatic sulfonate ABC transporter substrate-binding protein [Yaniella halotolerans]